MKSHSVHLRSLLLALTLFCVSGLFSFAATTNPAAVTALLNRIGGTGTADRFVTVIDESLSSDGKDVFVLTSSDGKPCIKGSSTLAVTTGINWYLNHVAHINLAWNNLTTDLASASLPLPTAEETHTSRVDYRYYLNYCTFSYSMSTWTWERWQQEIDWMALHGINMPLQIVGLDVVWNKLLTEDLGYTQAEANNFIAGPCFQAWWGMNNLQGWGGANPDWWYKRQETLAKNILARERELGMEPVLPGYAGMVPSDIESKKGYKANNQGNWCNFVRPYILDPNSTAFTEISEKYYARLAEVMGTSTYYSMDPFHEGANTDGIDVASAYTQLAAAMTKTNANAKWVIQFWQWSGAQYNVLSKVEKGKLIVLDLFSDAHSHFGDYQGHDAVYCALPNFGGRTGLFGRLSKEMTDFFDQKSAHSNVKGIGATPEAIEQVPVLYDALFELPWLASKPDPKTWLADYAVSRYGAQNDNAQAAWEKVRNSALNCETSLQGPQEAVLCARPALSVGSVSSWGGTDIFYDAQQVADAAYLLLQANGSLSGENYSYDLTDFARQALTDYGYYLLKAINEAYTSGDKTAYAARRDAYLDLLTDVDKLLNTNRNFMLGRWTQMARAIADEAEGTTESDRQWLELNNARTLITTWGDRDQSEWGGLRDYSYREWGGMVKDFYRSRWETFFNNLDNNASQPSWFDVDWAWAHNASLSYSNVPEGNTADVATSLFGKYFALLTDGSGNRYHLYRYMTTDLAASLSQSAVRGLSYEVPLQALPEGVTATVGIDLNLDGTISDDETFSTLTVAIPSTASTGKAQVALTLSDGTVLKYQLTIKDNVTEPRTVEAKSADASQGSVSIEGSSSASVTNTDEVTMKAVPASGYDFLNWTDAAGNVVGTDNEYTYYGAAAATFTAHFIVNKWGMPAENLQDIADVKSYGQYLTAIAVAQNGSDERNIYNAESCPETLCHVTSVVNAAKGSEVTLHWTSGGGLDYCNLSAYADWNVDGDFTGTDELVKAYGTKESASNGALNDYTLKVLIPYAVPEGVTHIRLRFDGAWAKGYDASTGAMPAKAETYRMVYDIPLNVTSSSSSACTVTVQTDGSGHGTADANGQPDTYTYSVGEDVVLRAYPADGYQVYWTDKYNRRVPEDWVDGNFLRFRAPESGVYTAHFQVALPETLAFGAWQFKYTLSDNGEICLTEVVSGEGELVIPENYEGHPITGLSATALNGNTSLTSLTISASLTDWAKSSVTLSDTIKGMGESCTSVPLSNALAQGKEWQVSLNVTTDGSSFNQWGSSLLATGTEPLGVSYDNGFQLYLKKDGSIIVKMGSDEKYTFTNSQNASSFQVSIAHGSDNALTIAVTANGSTDTYQAGTYALNDIAQFCAALPSGVNITSLQVVEPDAAVAPLKGCANLTSLQVASGNLAYKSLDGGLYTADGTTLLEAIEGLPSHVFTLPADVTMVSSHAFTSLANVDYIVAQSTVPPTLLPTAFDDTDIHVLAPVQSLAAYRTAWGLPLLVAVEADEQLSDDVAAQLQSGDAVLFRANQDGVCGEAPSLSADVPVWLSLSFPANTLLPVCFPSTLQRLSVNDLLAAQASADDLSLYAYADGNFKQTAQRSAGAYLLGVPQSWLGKTVTLRFPSSQSSASIVKGFYGNGTVASVSGSTPYYIYNVSTDVFTLQTAEPSFTLTPFSACLVGDAASPETVRGPIATTSIKNASLSSSDKSAAFSLDGRGVSASHLKKTAVPQGVYVIGGQKVLVK